MDIITFEHIHITWDGQRIINQLIPVISEDAGRLLAEAAIAEERILALENPHISITHPNDNLWVIKERGLNGAEHIRMFAVIVRQALTIEDVRACIKKRYKNEQEIQARDVSKVY